MLIIFILLFHLTFSSNLRKLDENYVVIYNSRTGNTEKVAQAFKNKLNCQIQKISPSAGYNESYNDQLQQAQKEINQADSGTFPAIDTLNFNLTNFSTVVICTPIWYQRMSTPMQSFLYHHRSALKDKKILLSATSVSSPISPIVDDLKKLASESIYNDSLWVRTSEINNADSLVESFINRIENNGNPDNSGYYGNNNYSGYISNKYIKYFIYSLILILFY